MPRGPLRAALPSLRDLPSETQSVSAAHSVNECCFVDDEEAVVELVGGLDRGRGGSRHERRGGAVTRRVVVWCHKGGFLSRRVRQVKVARCDSAMLQGAT